MQVERAASPLTTDDNCRTCFSRSAILLCASGKYSDQLVQNRRGTVQHAPALADSPIIDVPEAVQAQLRASLTRIRPDAPTSNLTGSISVCPGGPGRKEPLPYLGLSTGCANGCFRFVHGITPSVTGGHFRWRPRSEGVNRRRCKREVVGRRWPNSLR